MEKYFEILKTIKAERIDITKLYLLSCVSNSYDEETKIKIMNYCYDVWIEADVDLDLSKLADVVCYEWNNIENKTFKKQDIIEMCYVN